MYVLLCVLHLCLIKDDDIGWNWDSVGPILLQDVQPIQLSIAATITARRAPVFFALRPSSFFWRRLKHPSVSSRLVWWLLRAGRGDRRSSLVASRWQHCYHGRTICDVPTALYSWPSLSS